MKTNRHSSLLLILVAASFALTTLTFSPGWAATDSSKQTYSKAKKPRVSSGARTIKEVNGRYVAQARPQNVASAPAPVYYGGWVPSCWNGQIYYTWSQPATAYGGSPGQTSGWSTPAQASGSGAGSAPATCIYLPPPPPANVVSTAVPVCLYSGLVPAAPGPASTGIVCSTTVCY